MTRRSAGFLGRFRPAQRDQFGPLVAELLTDWSTSKLSRIEIGQQRVDVHGVRSMLDLYDVGGDRWADIIDLTREARQKGWWHAYGISGQGYVGLETDASVVHDYQLAHVPGLLQTEDYMRALFRNSRQLRTAAEIDRDVRVRLLRQRRLTEQPTLELIAVVDESALRRSVGGVEGDARPTRPGRRPIRAADRVFTGAAGARRALRAGRLVHRAGFG